MIVQARKIPIVEPFAEVRDASQSIVVLGPIQAFYESLLPGFRGTPEPVAQPLGLLTKAFRGAEEVVKRIAENWNIETLDDTGETSAENNSNTILFVAIGDQCLLFTADAAEPGLQNAGTFQAWGRRGPDKKQALNLGIFYEDNGSKKRWVLKANDPKVLEDIDAVFVTVEPNGGSQHPSGKPLLFAYLRVRPNHP